MSLTGPAPLFWCSECGMILHSTDEYHPYAACLMFKQCQDSVIVRANLEAVKQAGYRAALPQPTTDVPTEPGAYWVKEPNWSKWIIVTTVTATRGCLMFFAVAPGYWYHPQPGTLWQRIPTPPEEQ